MFFPYSTDAPVYHWPYATVGIIVANVLVLLGVGTAGSLVGTELGELWLLSYGDGIQPAQWLLSPFLHGGVGHLVGNMVSLWAFGLIVEGKLGSGRSLIIYLLIAIGECALEQLVMLGVSTGGISFGASSAVCGVLAIAAIWAPDNTIAFFYWITLWFMGTVDIPVLGVAVAYISLDLVSAAAFGGLMGMGVTSGLLHLMGSAIGIPIGIILLRRGVVDCEGWDVFTRYASTSPTKKRDARRAKEQAHRKAEETAISAERELRTLDEAKRQFDEFLAGGSGLAAHKLYTKLRKVGDGWRLDAGRLAKLAKALASEKRYAEMAPHLTELIDVDPEHADSRRVSLAQVCATKLGRPGRALDLLNATSAEKLSEKQRQIAAAVRRKAEALQAEGIVELDDDEW